MALVRIAVGSARARLRVVPWRCWRRGHSWLAVSRDAGTVLVVCSRCLAGVTAVLVVDPQRSSRDPLDVALELVDAIGQGHPSAVDLNREAGADPNVPLHLATLAASLLGATFEQRRQSLQSLSLTAQISRLDP